MDIQKELQHFIENDGFHDNFIHEQIKKLHLLKVLSISSKFEKIVTTDFFSKENIKFLKVDLVADDERNKSYFILFKLLDINNQSAKNFRNKNYIEIHNFCESLLKNQLEGNGSLNAELLNLDLMPNPQYLELKPGIGEKLIDALLPDELKIILNYNKLQLDLNTNEQEKSPKMKI